jgi:uroporphyrinogen-III synthase
VTAGPLAGWRVLVPRAGEWGDRVSALLAEQGAVATIVPLIEFESPDDVAPLDAAVRRLADGDYTWLAVTSGTTVLALASRAAEALGEPSGPALARAALGTKVAAVGPGTARALERMAVEVQLVPTAERSARGLVAEFPIAGPDAGPDAALHARPDAAPGTGRVLFPHSDLADRTVVEGLRAKGWAVDDVVAYRTVTGALPSEEIRADARSGWFDAVLLSSASTARSLVEMVGSPPAATVIACIGPRTERAALENGLPVHVLSGSASAEGLVESLAAFAAEHPRREHPRAEDPRHEDPRREHPRHEDPETP